ncbi:MAG: hypothetical protein V4447_06620 [Pseudomonadota bacterium]
MTHNRGAQLLATSFILLSPLTAIANDGTGGALEIYFNYTLLVAGIVAVVTFVLRKICTKPWAGLSIVGAVIANFVFVLLAAWLLVLILFNFR